MKTPDLTSVEYQAILIGLNAQAGSLLDMILDMKDALRTKTIPANEIESTKMTIEMWETQKKFYRDLGEKLRNIKE